MTAQLDWLLANNILCTELAPHRIASLSARPPQHILREIFLSYLANHSMTALLWIMVLGTIENSSVGDPLDAVKGDAADRAVADRIDSPQIVQGAGISAPWGHELVLIDGTGRIRQ